MFDVLRYQEFDWFALDQTGEIAIFSTAGQGIIPETVGNNYVAHQLISTELNLPNLGSLKVWSDFATYGLYVYDWQFHAGPYKREAVPLTIIAPVLRQRIFEVPAIPKLDITFGLSLSIII